jgi:hypothetical protein
VQVQLEAICQAIIRVPVIVSVPELGVENVPLSQLYSSAQLGRATWGTAKWARKSKVLRHAIGGACLDAARSDGVVLVEVIKGVKAAMSTADGDARAKMIKISRVEGLEDKLCYEVLPKVHEHVKESVVELLPLVLSSLDGGYSSVLTQEALNTIQRAFNGCFLEELVHALSEHSVVWSESVKNAFEKVELKENVASATKRIELEGVRKKLMDARNTIEELDSTYREIQNTTRG